MGKMKKILCMLLVCAMVIVPCSVLGNISAQTADSEPLKIEVTTDKSSYNAYGIAEITVNITNTSTETINNISAEAVFNDLAPVGKNNETSKEIESLKSGESFSFSYKATVNSNKVKLNFFEKIILWFVRLFNGGYTATGNNFDDNREYISRTNVIDFGNVSANNEIKVWYIIQNNLTQPNYDDIAFVDISLDYIESDEFKSLNIEEKREKVNNTLNDLAEQGYINKESIAYNESGKYFYFENSSTNWENYIFLEFDEDHNEGSANDIELRHFLNDIRSTLSYKSSNSILDTIETANSKTNLYSENCGNAVIMYGLDSCGKIEEDTDLNNYYISFLKGEANGWGEKNLRTVLYTDTTVELYKFALKNKKLIVIEEHGVDYNDENEHNKVSFVLKEKVSESKDEKYSTDLDKKYIWKVNGRYAINPSFFSHYYKNQLSDSIIYLGSCRGLGFGGIENHRFSYAFDTDGNAKCTLGFHNDVRVDYSMNLMSCFVGNLLYGRTTKFSLDYAKSNVGEKGPNGEYAIITSYYSTLYEQYNVTGFVKDEITNNAISGVSIEIVDNNFYNQNPVMTTTTDENGQFSINLPYGDYSISFNHENYEDYGTSLTVDSDYVVLNNPILLTRKTTLLKSTVKDKETDVPIAGVIIEAIDNESGSLTPVATATTDENGQFSIRVPYGNNSLSFTHEDYEYYEKTASINSDNHLLVKLLFQAEPILLTAKNKPIEAVAFLGRNISEVINYYGDYYLDTSIEGGHAFCFNDFIFVITENAYAGLEPQNVVSIISGNTNAILYNGLHSNMSYNDLIKIVPDIEKPQYYYDEIDDEVIYSTTFKYGNYVFNYRWKDYYPSDDEICWEVIVNIAEQTQTCITQMEIVDHGQYTGNEGDSCIFHLDKNGLPGIHNTYYAFGNVGIDETVYENGIEAWIARWNNTSEISWTYATYKLDSKYTTLTGKTDLIKSNNIDNFNTTVYFYDGDKLLASYTLTNEDYKKDINVDVTGVDELKILVQDNVAVKKGTSYALYDMFLT